MGGWGLRMDVGDDEEESRVLTFIDQPGHEKVSYSRRRWGLHK